MGDINHEFSIFYNQISLSASPKKNMHTTRLLLRGRIRRYFQNNPSLCPSTFLNYGRQATATTIAPNYGETLVEEGVLLQHLGKKIIMHSVQCKCAMNS